MRLWSGNPEKGAGVATIGVGAGGPYAIVVELAKQIEAKGFDAVWVSETNQDSIVLASVIGQATEHIDVGTNITLAFPRSPVVTAMSAWDLNELTGDRFVLGLGSQVKRIIEERFSADFDRPAKRMGEYVQAMDTVWRQERGENITFEGEIYGVKRPGLNGLGRATDRKLPRTYVAAVGPLMVKAAATYADGILGHPFTSDRYIANHVVPSVEDALGEVGRDRGDFQVCTGLIVSIDDDRQSAINDAKAQIAFYGSTPNYKPVFASYGDEYLTDILNRTFKQSKGNLDAMIAAVPDEAVERYAVAGTPAEVKDRMADYDNLVDHVIVGPPWFKQDFAKLGARLWAILETLGPKA
ncbi:MAG: putative F420-dependent oxidoreductase [Glaciecola sp.]|jgi:probable F420-dependent oxidoreductase